MRKSSSFFLQIRTRNWSQVVKQREHLEEPAEDKVIIFNFLLHTVREHNRNGQGNMQTYGLCELSVNGC